MTDLAIIAGEGALVSELARRFPEAPVYAVPGTVPPVPATPFRIERLVPLMDDLAAKGVSRVVFAGAVRRPVLEPEMFDPRTAQLVPRFVAALGSGDDAALRIILEIFEEFDLTVCGIEEITPDFLPGAGVLVGTPTDRDRADADRAAAVLAATGPLDIGQGCVVAGGLCLAIETQPGTAAMLDFVARHRTGQGGVLMKAPKPVQDRRIDLPAIGPDTVDQAAAAGLNGIVFTAGGVILLDRDKTLHKARDAGLFLWAQ